MKLKINYIIIILLITIGWTVGYFNQYIRVPEIVIQEVEKTRVVKDTVFVDNIVEKEIIVPKYIIKRVTDTVVKELVVEKPIEVIKTIYKDRPVDRVIEIMRPKQSKLFLGFGYHYDKDNYFSGSNIELLYKAPGDKMFGLQVGFRNDLLDVETGVSRLRPYIGGSVYFRLDKDKN